MMLVMIQLKIWGLEANLLSSKRVYFDVSSRPRVLVLSVLVVWSDPRIVEHQY